jgi:hypothetical protein
MNYKQWLAWYIIRAFDYPPDAKDGWFACKREILKLLNAKIPKVPGMEDLGGYSWYEMGAEEYRDILINKIKKL